LGDATTPQISALFFGGKPEHLEPEGRKGVKGNKRKIKHFSNEKYFPR